jgi:signal transduction histidine kinase
VRQILRTLLDNAYHYTPENGEVVVAMRTVPRRSEIQVEVIDNGIGIAEADQARVFDRFFRGENPLVLATPGTGLGLSIARQLVEMHGGSITVQSDGVEGHGSTFSFTLPVKKSAESAAGEAPVERPKRKNASRAKVRASARPR